MNCTKCLYYSKDTGRCTFWHETIINLSVCTVFDPFPAKSEGVVQ